MKKKNKVHKRKDFEIKFYEGLVKRKPDFIQALHCLGEAYTRQGFYEDGLAIDKRLAHLKPEDPIVHYNLACSLSLLGYIDEAIEELKRAILLGYDDLVFMLKDKDLENVRKSEKFTELIEKLKRLWNE